MEIRELLSEIRRLNREIAFARKRKDNLAECALKATSRLSAVRYGGTPDHCKHEYAVLESTEIDKALAELEIERRVYQRKLEPFVRVMPQGRERAAIKIRYLDGLSVAAMARRLGYERRYAYKLLEGAESALIQLEKKTH